MNKNIDWRTNLTIAGVTSALTFIGVAVYCTCVDAVINAKGWNN